MLQAFKQQLLQELPLIEQCEVRWHVAQMLPRLVMNEAELSTAVDALYSFLDAKSKIVQVNAMQALADIAAVHSSMQAELGQLFQTRASVGSSAVRARARELAAQFSDAGKKKQTTKRGSRSKAR